LVIGEEKACPAKSLRPFMRSALAKIQAKWFSGATWSVVAPWWCAVDEENISSPTTNHLPHQRIV
jgi:hypothetical protein